MELDALAFRRRGVAALLGGAKRQSRSARGGLDRRGGLDPALDCLPFPVSSVGPRYRPGWTCISVLGRSEPEVRSELLPAVARHRARLGGWPPADWNPAAAPAHPVYGGGLDLRSGGPGRPPNSASRCGRQSLAPPAADAQPGGRLRACFQPSLGWLGRVAGGQRGQRQSACPDARGFGSVLGPSPPLHAGTHRSALSTARQGSRLARRIRRISNAAVGIHQQPGRRPSRRQRRRYQERSAPAEACGNPWRQ